MEKIEIPPGLVRTWKVAVFMVLNNIFVVAGGYFLGHSYARVVEKEVRVEVPVPACRDEMIQVSGDDAKKHMSCPNPDHSGRFETVYVGGWTGNVPFLVCTCPHPQIALPDGGLLEAGTR